MAACVTTLAREDMCEGLTLAELLCIDKALSNPITVSRTPGPSYKKGFLSSCSVEMVENVERALRKYMSSHCAVTVPSRDLWEPADSRQKHSAAMTATVRF